MISYSLEVFLILCSRCLFSLLGGWKVKMFHNDGEGENDRSAEKRARNQIGTYVRVFGNVS